MTNCVGASYTCDICQGAIPNGEALTAHTGLCAEVIRLQSNRGPLSREGSAVLTAARVLTAELVKEIGAEEISKELDMEGEDDASRAVYTFIRSVLAYEKALAEFEHM